MNKLNAAIELMRLDKPIGIYLLLWPALLALVVGTHGNFTFVQALIVISGSILDQLAASSMIYGIKTWMEEWKGPE